MHRTSRRPLPAGRLQKFDALLVSSTTGMAGLFILSHYVSPVAALLAFGALAYYILIYTLWLKRKTYWSSIIGSGAGAFPPLIGWIAITGHVDVIPFILFGIIALWTPPHYWALAIFRRHEYEKAGLNAIPRRNVSTWIAGFSMVLISSTTLLAILARLGTLYLITSIILGVILLSFSFGLIKNDSGKTARQLYYYSMIYLSALFVTIPIDILL
jgi:protoheme IX farnesyltransferase